jgi:hypothetical protein
MNFLRLTLTFVSLTAASIVAAQPSPPVPPSSPEAAYPDCSGEFQNVPLIRGKLASLRRCRMLIQHFQSTSLQSFGVALNRYKANLIAYRDQVRTADLTPQQRQAARQTFEREMERVLSGGDLVSTHLRMIDRSGRDLSFINGEICRLGRQRGPYCS